MLGKETNRGFMSEHNLKCASCGSVSLVRGKTGGMKHTFIPDGKLMFLGHRTTAQLCLDCGFVGHYLAERDIEEMRK